MEIIFDQESAIYSTNLEILNRGNDPTFCTGRRLDLVDITLVSFELPGSVKS
jgi:hypothetical protein